jgi:hypothetical protein
MTAEERAKALAEKLLLHNGDIPWGYARDIEDATAVAIREAEVAAAAKERERCLNAAEEVRRRYEELRRATDVPDDRQWYKALAGGAGECAAAIRAPGVTP